MPQWAQAGMPRGMSPDRVMHSPGVSNAAEGVKRPHAHNRDESASVAHLASSGALQGLKQSPVCWRSQAEAKLPPKAAVLPASAAPVQKTPPFPDCIYIQSPCAGRHAPSLLFLSEAPIHRDACNKGTVRGQNVFLGLIHNLSSDLCMSVWARNILPCSSSTELRAGLRPDCQWANRAAHGQSPLLLHCSPAQIAATAVWDPRPRHSP